MIVSELHEPVGDCVWRQRYRMLDERQIGEPNIEAGWRRVARALAAVEPAAQPDWEQRFLGALRHFRFLPGGRILAGLGAAEQRCLFNCFVLGELHDSVAGIFSALSEAMLTLQAGGGIGVDFSPLRPRGAATGQAGVPAAGPLAFMRLWDQACSTMAAMPGRAAAMQAALRCDHPDIVELIEACAQGLKLRHMTVSILVSDAFLQAVEADAEWPLVMPCCERSATGPAAIVERVLPGSAAAQACQVLRSVRARQLWRSMGAAAVQQGQPGVLFVDRLARRNNLFQDEQIVLTNPCGEVPLPPHGACDLGSINLAAFVQDPFGAHPSLDMAGIEATAALATRMLDNVIELSAFPLRAQARVVQRTRRIGLGITGLGSALAMLDLRYGSSAGCEVAAAAMRTVCLAAYRTSVQLAREKGAFPAYRPERFLAAPFVGDLPPELREEIRHHGIRNSHLTAIAPAGGISLLANNVSCGAAPIRALLGHREVNGVRLPVRDHALAVFRQRFGDAALPTALAQAEVVSPAKQLAMIGALQRWVDQGISHTIWLPRGAEPAAGADQFDEAYRLGLKGCTLFRPLGRRAED